ncbi:hypothetical protein [Iodobacter sp.]|uniref:hypothetical protein n=1 Tax=Iodobacter sp. TaxID=1915058 RepID=UPI0025DDFDF2|nr:hypothetical protein [Iodobacter sp.]
MKAATQAHQIDQDPLCDDCAVQQHGLLFPLLKRPALLSKRVRSASDQRPYVVLLNQQAFYFREKYGAGTVMAHD